MAGRAPTRVDPTRSLWHLFGTALRRARLAAGKTLEEVGKAVCVTATRVGRWERGERPVPKDLIGLLDEAVEADDFLIALHDFVLNAERTAALAAQAADPTDPEVMDRVRRRLLLGMAAMGTASAVPPLEGVEALRHLLGGREGVGALEEWQETAWEYAHRIVIGDRAAVVYDLGIDLLELQAAMSRAPAGDAPGWARVRTKMLFLVAYGLSTTGRFREARHWWTLARNSAAHADDGGELLALVGGYEAMQGLFAERPMSFVLRTANATVTMANGRAHAGVAEAWGAIAQANARLGRAAEAEKALQAAADTYERLPDSVTRDRMAAGAWPVDRLLHARSFVYSHLGDLETGQRARDQVLPTYPKVRRRQIALLRLHESVALVHAGDVRGGLDHAQQVIAELPPAERPGLVTTAATWVADAVPPAQQALSQVVDYRHALAADLGGR